MLQNSIINYNVSVIFNKSIVELQNNMIVIFLILNNLEKSFLSSCLECENINNLFNKHRSSINTINQEREKELEKIEIQRKIYKNNKDILKIKEKIIQKKKSIISQKMNEYKKKKKFQKWEELYEEEYRLELRRSTYDLSSCMKKLNILKKGINNKFNVKVDEKKFLLNQIFENSKFNLKKIIIYNNLIKYMNFIKEYNQATYNQIYIYSNCLTYYSNLKMNDILTKQSQMHYELFNLK